MSGVSGKEIGCHFGSIKVMAMRLLAYILDSTFEPDEKKNEEVLAGLISKCLYFAQSTRFLLSGYLRNEDKQLLWIELWAAAESLFRCKRPIRHFVFSFKDRILSSEEFHKACVLIAEHLGVDECLWVSAAHRDTQNFHIHFVCVTEILDQDGHHKVTINGRWTKTAAQKVCARLCHEFHIQPGENSMLEYRPTEKFKVPIFRLEEGHFFIREEYKPSRPLVYHKDGEQKVLLRALKPAAPILDRLLRFEERTGRKSNQRVFQEILIPCLDRLIETRGNWDDVHHAFNEVGFEVHKTENGGGFVSRGAAKLRLSLLGGQYSMQKLESAFGSFDSPSEFSLKFGLNSCLDLGVPILPKEDCVEFYEYESFLAERERVDHYQDLPEIPKPMPKSFKEFKLKHASSSVSVKPRDRGYKRPVAQRMSEKVACIRQGDDLVYLDISRVWPRPLFVDKGDGVYMTRKDRPSLREAFRLAFKKWLNAPVMLACSEKIKPYVLGLLKKRAEKKAPTGEGESAGLVMETKVSERPIVPTKLLSVENTPDKQNDSNLVAEDVSEVLKTAEIVGGVRRPENTEVSSNLDNEDVPIVPPVLVVPSVDPSQETHHVSGLHDETDDEDESDDEDDSGPSFSI